MSEWLTDKEKRLLFSALTREKKVCAEVDKESCREPYEESLVSVVKSLEHKFYYDRLFKRIEKQIREDAINECIKILTDDCKCEYEKLTCFECMTKRMEQLKEQTND